MDPADGLVPARVDNIARQTLAQLRERWGVRINDADVPTEVVVAGMKREVWVRVGSARGVATVYELRSGGGSP